MKLFDHDGPLMRALTYLGNLILLNLVFLLCCLPVVTAGAACAALYTVTANFASAFLGYYLAEPVWRLVVSIS